MNNEKEKTTLERIEEKLAKYPRTIWIILTILGILIGGGVLRYFSYQEGYNIGIEEGKQSIEAYEYPIKVVAENVYTLSKNKTAKIVVEYYNPSDHKAFINRFYMRIPSEEWKVLSITIPINETEKEKTEVIEIRSEAKVFDIGERRPIPFDIKTPNISGDYRIAFCIEYADGTEMCPRISWVSVR